MKGIPIKKLKALQPKRFGRSAALLGAVSLVAGGMLLGGGVAHAAVGTVPGALTLNPASGSLNTTPTYSTTVGCKTGFQGSAVVKEVHADGTTNNVTAANASVVNPFTGTFQGTIGAVEGFAGANPGDTIELVVFCFSGPSGTGTPDPEQSTFLTFSADGTSYSTSATAPSQPSSTTTLQVSPNPAQTGQTVTLTATVTISDSSTPNGTVTFSTGGSAIGSPVTVGVGGIATTTTTFSTSGTVSVTAAFAPAAGVHVSGSTSSAIPVSVIPAGGFFEPLAVTVPTSGVFTLTVGAGTVSLTVNGAGTSATGQLFPITVSDTRNTFPGWSVSGQAAHFLNTTSNPHGDISGDQLGWVPTDTQLTDAVLGGTVNPATPGLGTTAAVLASAAAGHGVGTSVLSANLTLNIPTGSPAGAYSSNLTLTAVQSGA